MPKTIAVFGATGLQGGAVARALARDKANFGEVRGLTRDLQQQDKVDDLKNNGVTVVQCDLDNVGSITSALQGTDGCFVVTYTDISEPNCVDKEEQRGKNIADACKAVNVPHVIYSTQMNTTEILGFEVRHLVGKARIEQYMTSLNLPMTPFLVPCYYENFFDYLKPRKVNGNNYVLEIPMGITPLDLVSVEDVGEVAKLVFLNRDKFLRNNKTLSLCGAKKRLDQIAGILSQYLQPLQIKDRPVTVNDYQKMGKPWSVDFGNMFDFFVRKDQRYQVEHTKDLYPEVQTFEQWVCKNASRLASSFAEQDTVAAKGIQSVLPQ